MILRKLLFELFGALFIPEQREQERRDCDQPAGDLMRDKEEK